jgi:hypothetical protein
VSIGFDQDINPVAVIGNDLAFNGDVTAHPFVCSGNASHAREGIENQSSQSVRFLRVKIERENVAVDILVVRVSRNLHECRWTLDAGREFNEVI